MSFQPANEKKKDPILNHFGLVKQGPKLVGVRSAPKWVKNNTLCVIELSVDGVNHVYFTNNRDISDKFSQVVGKQVVLIASGNSKQGTDSMEIQEAGVPASQIQQPQQSVAKPVSSFTTTTPAQPVQQHAAPIHKDLDAKKYLCQAANLMRLCVKKANDIAVELGLPDAHRQVIASGLFINADRAGFIPTMPISAYSSEELGMGASKAENLAKPEPSEPDEF